MGKCNGGGSFEAVVAACNKTGIEIFKYKGSSEDMLWSMFSDEFYQVIGDIMVGLVHILQPYKLQPANPPSQDAFRNRQLHNDKAAVFCTADM